MTTPNGCPSCAAPLTGAPVCASCGLPLTGPTAARLWQVDQQLAALQTERTWLLDRLRAGDAAPPAQQWGQATAQPQQWSHVPAHPQQWGAPARAPRESSPKQVQNTLLTLGAVLLALAGVVFAAVTYHNLGVVGRAVVLLTLTAVAAAAPVALFRRSLTASAEAVSAVGVALSLLDAYALRKAGVAEHVDGSLYAAVATAVVAVALAGYSVVVPLRVPRYSAAVLAQVPVPCLLGAYDATSAVAAAVLPLQAAVDLLVAQRVRLEAGLRTLVLVLGGLTALVALLTEPQAVRDGRGSWVGFAVLGLLAAVVASQFADVAVAGMIGAGSVPLLAAAAWAGTRPDLTTVQQPLVVIAVGVIAAQAAALLPEALRARYEYGALVVAGIGVVAEGGPLAQAVFGPLGWLGDPWTRTATAARADLGPHLVWDGSIVTVVVLAGAALTVATAGLVLDVDRITLPATAALLVGSAVTLPLGLATSFQDALVILLVIATAMGVAAALVPVRGVGIALVWTSAAIALLAAAWSTADEDATLTVVAVTAGLVAALSFVEPGVLTGIALALMGAELAAVGASKDLHVEQVGGLLLGSVALSVALSWVPHEKHRLGAEGAAIASAISAVALSAPDPGWLSWTLAGSGLAGLIVAVRRDRRAVGVAGGVLLAASSWVRLADAGVHAPEPYVLPLAVVALVTGVLRRRSHPTAGSWECYATGLSLGLAPSLLRSFADDTPTRGLVLLAVAVVVVLVGAKWRLQAPLVLGSITVVLDGLGLLAPYARALPRWTLLATGGVLLVFVGATYEARLRNVRALRERYDALS